MKGYFVGGYVALIFVFWIYLSNWGALAYKGAAYNLGRALIWPVVIFPSLGQIIGGIVIIGLVLLVTIFARKRA